MNLTFCCILPGLSSAPFLGAQCTAHLCQQHHCCGLLPLLAAEPISCWFFFICHTYLVVTAAFEQIHLKPSRRWLISPLALLMPLKREGRDHSTLEPLFSFKPVAALQRSMLYFSSFTGFTPSCLKHPASYPFIRGRLKY